MIKILIADDEPLVQIGLRSMISWSSLGAEICGTASNGDAAWEMIREHHPDHGYPDALFLRTGAWKKMHG